MRLVFFLLVLANLVFFAWAQGYFGGQDEGREPQRLADQLQPEKMKVTVPEKHAAAPVPADVCRLVSGLAAREAEQLQQALAAASGLTVSLRPGEETPGFWVSIPALAGKAQAERKAGELKLLGVTDFHVMQTAGDVFAISLGVFGSEPVAVAFLAGLHKKGVKSARIDARPKPGLARIEVRGSANAVAQHMSVLLSGAVADGVSDCP